MSETPKYHPENKEKKVTSKNAEDYANKRHSIEKKRYEERLSLLRSTRSKFYQSVSEAAQKIDVKISVESWANNSDMTLKYLPKERYNFIQLKLNAGPLVRGHLTYLEGKVGEALRSAERKPMEYMEYLIDTVEQFCTFLNEHTGKELQAQNLDIKYITERIVKLHTMDSRGTPSTLKRNTSSHVAGVRG